LLKQCGCYTESGHICGHRRTHWRFWAICCATFREQNVGWVDL